jgi:predicted MFS family arabinose efflux permease
MIMAAALPLQIAPAVATTSTRRHGMPSRFWLFAAFAVLYGLCETMNGNWSQLDVTTSLGGSTTQAALALTAFWAMVTVGRVFFAAIARRLPPRAVFHMLPLVLVVTFILTAALPDDTPWLAVVTFGLAGLGCSALLPLTISLGQDALPTMSAAVTGGVIAFYQIGYGVAAFGVGPVVDHGVSLSKIFAATAFVAGAMWLLSFAVSRRSEPVRGSHVAA